MKILKTAALVAALMAAACTPSKTADVVIKDDMGGVIVDFVKKYSDMRDTKDRLVIDGECASACTLFLGILPKDRFCVTHSASLGFHSASSLSVDGVLTHAPEFTLLTWNLYPKRVRKALRARGWDGGNEQNNAHPDIIWIKGQQLTALIAECR